MPARPEATWIVWVTTPDLRTARRLARLALDQRLVACAQVRTGVESHYLWEGRRERSQEVLLTFKTVARRLKALEKLVVTHHPYDTPQFIAVRAGAGTAKYLDWIRDSTA